MTRGALASLALLSCAELELAWLWPKKNVGVGKPGGSNDAMGWFGAVLVLAGCSRQKNTLLMMSVMAMLRQL